MELKDSKIVNEVNPLIIKIADAASEGYLPGGGMIYEMNMSHNEIDADRHWWVQSEAIVGYANLYQHFQDMRALDKACSDWEFVKNNMIDKEKGEWFWSIRADGTVNRDDDKAGFWKCPYHNGRMCMEIIERF